MAVVVAIAVLSSVNWELLAIGNSSFSASATAAAAPQWSERLPPAPPAPAVPHTLKALKFNLYQI